jgi:hypothetical protein
MAARSVSGLDTGGGLVAGTRLGPYAIVSPLGAGGMGEVYRAVDTRLGREVAVKVLAANASDDAGRRRRFEREAQLASAVSHPNVVTLFDVGEWHTLPYVVSELLEGETLRAHLRPGLLTPREAASYGVQIAHGLAALHPRGIVHRDLKPENLFVTSDGRIKILDLGLAGPSREDDHNTDEPWETLTTEGAAVGGTAAYMSPEQVRRLPADARSDIFGCGVVLYEMLVRRRPFHEETAAETMTAILRREPRSLLELDPSLPGALVRVVERCLAKRPEDRFHSAHDLALALAATLEVTPPPATRESAPEAKVRGRARDDGVKRRGQRASLLAVAILATIAFWFWRGGSGHYATVPVLAKGTATLLGYDAAQGGFTPFMQGIAAEGVDIARDRRRAAYTSYPDGELWTSGVDGRDARRLTEGPLRAALPRWSPDGGRIAFAGRSPGGTWRIHLVSADGGPIEVLPPENVTDPGWTHDGQAILFGGLSSEPSTIFRWDLDSRRQTIVSGSSGLFSPRPSPDGRLLAALRQDSLVLVIQDVATGQWSQLTEDPVSYPAWTLDNAWLHFRSEGGGGRFYRIDPRSGRQEEVAAVVESALAGGEWGAWSGLTPDGAPLLLVDRAQRGMAVLVEPSRLEERKTTR